MLFQHHGKHRLGCSLRLEDFHKIFLAAGFRVHWKGQAGSRELSYRVRRSGHEGGQDQGDTFRATGDKHQNPGNILRVELMKFSPVQPSDVRA